MNYGLRVSTKGWSVHLAIECDGDAWHGPDAYQQDLARQRDLERCGWQFFRIRESAYYIDPVAVIDQLWRTLEELDIHPSGWMDDEMIDEEDQIPEDDKDQAGAEGEFLLHDGVHDDLMLGVSAPDGPSGDVIAHAPDFEAGRNARVDVKHRPVSDGVAASPSAFEPRTGSNATRELEAGAPAESSEMPHYQITDFRAPSALEGPDSDVRQGLIKIVSVEGPVTGGRLQHAYVSASGGHRVGKRIAKALNRQITKLVQENYLVADNPTGGSGVKPKTYRLPSQPKVRVRELGPRALDEVPPLELAALLIRSAESLPTTWDDTEALYRVALGSLGLVRMTTGVMAKLDEAHKLADSLVEEEISSEM